MTPEREAELRVNLETGLEDYGVADEALNAVAELRGERDDFANKLHAARNLASVEVSANQLLTRERDAARVEVKRLRCRFAGLIGPKEHVANRCCE